MKCGQPNAEDAKDSQRAQKKVIEKFLDSLIPFAFFAKSLRPLRSAVRLHRLRLARSAIAD